MKKLIPILLFLTSASFAQLGGPAIDPRIQGVTEDGSSAGAVRVRIEKGDLVKVPLAYTRYSISEAYGSAAATQYRAFPGYSTQPNYWNADGSSSALQIDCPAVNNVGTNVSGGLHLWFLFSGPAIGWRWNTGFGTSGVPTTNEFGFMVDGVSYEIANYIDDIVTGGTGVGSSGTGTLEDQEHNVLIADDLSKGVHRCDLYFPAATSGQKSWMVFGPILSRLAGYEEYPRNGTFSAGGLLTTSAATVVAGNGRAVRKLFYCNQDSVARTVTLLLVGNDVRYLYLTAKGTSGDSQEFDFGVPVAFETANSGSGSFAHKADSASVVRWFPSLSQ